MIKNKKVVAVVAARMGSTRLPGKVMMPLAGKPVIYRIVERLRGSKYIDDVIVATTSNQQDDVIEKLCVDNNFRCHRGSESDVLSRVAEAARLCEADVVFRGMADSPVLDWRIIDFLIERLVDGDYQYASNELGDKPYPLGFDASVFPAEVLYEADREAKDEMCREHVTYYIYNHPEKYRIYKLQAEGERFWPELRLTLDTKEDYELISIVYDNFIESNPDFSSGDIIDFLKDNLNLLRINRAIKQKIFDKKSP